MPQRKVLAMKLRSLGDTVLMTAPLLELKKAYPDAELHVAVLSRWAPLFEDFPGIDKLWVYDRHKETGARAKALARVALGLRRKRFDLVVNFHASPSSATIAFATGAKKRSIHFHGHKDKNRYSTVEIPGKGTVKPVIERDMDALRALELKIPAGRLPHIPLKAVEKEQADQWLKQTGLTGPVLGIGLGASRPTKSWPAQRFAQLAIRWCEETQGSALVPAGPEDTDSLKAFTDAVNHLLDSTQGSSEVRAAIRRRIVAQQNLPIRKLAALQSRLAVFAGNDSGPKHLAIAVGTPTVTLFGPEDPFEWHPYPQDQHPFLFIADLPCRKDAQPGMPPWCGVNPCIDEAHRCMRNIGVDEVFSACRKIAGSQVE